jgi:GTP cyclohydrolase II/3,4-dihydroxy-2-butanone 4-phosphate synthase
MKQMSDSIEKALKALARGDFVVVADDEDRENEGDLILAAEKATKEALAFMIRHTSGIICVPLLKERLESLDLPQMVCDNRDPHRTAFTVSVDSRFGTTTGISAQDRATTILALVNEATQPSDFHRPGHIFPLMARKGGVLERPGHTEATVDLCRLAGLYPGGVLAEVVNDDGSVMNGHQLKEFAKEYNLPFITIADLIAYRKKHDCLVVEVSSARLPTAHGDFTMTLFRSIPDGQEHIALVKGTIDPTQDVLVRIHSECITGDVFRSKRCDCGDQLERAMEAINQAGSGVVIYLQGHEGRGIGLGNKLAAYCLQDAGQDTVEANLSLGFPADLREYSVATHILEALGIKKIQLMTNNLHKYQGIQGSRIEITRRIPIISPETPENAHYLSTKREKMGHLI